MRLVRGSHCFVWGSLGALLYAGPANPQRDIEAAFALDVRAALASDAHVAGPDLTAAHAAPEATAAGADPIAKVALTEPAVDAALLKPSDECLATLDCIDQYLWSVYGRARKIDTIKVKERIKVTVTEKGKSRTVMKTITKLVDEDFTWKDPHAARKAGMLVPEYVIGGMDRGFKARLYRLFRALDDAGLAPGMTSGFRDDYRQSIARGNKAASGSSYHGGSRRGGYGHGLAADVVSVKGETSSERWSSSERLWKWIDVHGNEFGIGRPYLDKDPPHIAPIDGKEYADKRGAKAKHAAPSPKSPAMKASEVRANSVGIAIGAKVSSAVP